MKDFIFTKPLMHISSAFEIKISFSFIVLIDSCVLIKIICNCIVFKLTKLTSVFKNNRLIYSCTYKNIEKSSQRNS